MTSRLMLLAATTIMGFAGVATTATTRGVDEDEAAIRETIQRYFDAGMEVRKAFWPEARMLYVRDGELQIVPIQDYIARAEARADQPKPTDVSKKIL